MNNDNDTEMMSSHVGNESSVAESELVYGSAVRLSMAEDIVRNICNMVPVIVVSGEKKEGKSTLCRMVVKEIPDDWETIYFDKTVESFEDVVREVARIIGCGEVDVSRSGMNSSIEIIGERLQEIGKQIVTVFDEAEMIYLATLERIRKMLDQLNVDGVKMQVILCGRPLLLENLKQLTIVQFREVPEKRYSLEPLTIEDTGTYIDFLVHNPTSGVSGSFLPTAIRQIHAITGGNISKVRDCVTRICSSDDRDGALAEMLARSSQKKKSFDVAVTLKPIVERSVEKVQSFSRRNWMIGGGVCIALLFLFFLFSGGEEKDVQVVGGVQKEPLEQVQQVPASEEKTADPVAEKVTESLPEKVLEQVPEVVAETPVQPPGVVEDRQHEEQTEETVTESVTVTEPVVTVPIPQEKTPLKEVSDKSEQERVDEPVAQSVTDPEEESGDEIPVMVQVEEEETDLTINGEVPIIAPVIYKRVVVDPGNSESNIVISTLAESEKREVEVIPSNPYKILKPVEPLDEQETSTSSQLQFPLSPVVEVEGSEQSGIDTGVHQEEPVEEKIKKPILGQAIVVEGETGPPVSRDAEAAKTEDVKEITEVVGVAGSGGDPLLESRMEAGFPWLAGRRNDSYTMQLMILSSDNAEETIKGILSQREYKRASDKFYIFRKDSTPPVYFVFYGEYGNVTAARKARNEIPVFLRNHRPYVLSVPSAMRKVKL